MSSQVSPFGDEFGLVEHHLRIQTQAPQLKITEMLDITQKAGTFQFQTFVKSMENPNIVHVFLDASTLQQGVADITSKGVRLPTKNGLQFNASKVTLPPGKEEYTLVHLIVALGKVSNYLDPVAAISGDNFLPLENVTSANIPQGYDSLRTSAKGDFVIFKPQQYNTLHIIKIKGGDNVAAKPLDCMKCDNCHKQYAVFYCTNDNMKLCINCDQKIHSSGVAKNHVRKPLGEVLPTFQPCPEHPDHMVQYYCEQCALPVCIECKVHGNHSHRDTLKHKLTGITQAYEQIGAKMNIPNPVRVNREKVLKASIAEAEDTVQNLQTNLTNVLAEIKRIADAASNEAKQLIGRRIVEAKSSLAELQRKYDQLKSTNTMLENYYTDGDPVPFLQEFHRTEVLDKDIETTLDLQRVNGIKADVAVFGSLSIQSPKPVDIPKAIERSLPRGTTTSHNQSSWPTSTTHRDADEESEKGAKITTLDKMAERKRRKYGKQFDEIDFVPFEGSEIIEDEETARKLYLCFPFKGMPETHLMFSTSSDGRDIQEMHRQIDGKGITVILIKAGGHVFGGFAASKWNSEMRPFGENSSSFLFSIDRNAFIPAHPQSEDPVFLCGTPDSFAFGRDDLVLAGNFDRCASTIENTFGIGLEYGSEAAQKFLAGQPRFKADNVEVWGFFSPAN